MKVDLEKFRERSKYIIEHKHDTLPLIIWNYSHSCQYDKAWDEFTKITRGLITDLEGNVVERTFPKFFNIGETSESALENLPAELPQITEKMDGSLGILYFTHHMPTIATRGSFNSDQAAFATKWIRSKYMRSDFIEGYTYLFEIIYPENRIVINYKDDKKLVLLAVIDVETGEELDLKKEAGRLKIEYPKIFKGELAEAQAKMSSLSGDEEGFVARYKNGLRIKMKGEEYSRLHRLITGFSTKSIWECLKNDQNLDSILKDVPDEFYTWTRAKEKEIKQKHKDLTTIAYQIFKAAENLESRKEQALFLIKESDGDRTIAGLVFAFLDKKDVDKIAWKFLKPAYELPFRTDIDS